MEELGVEAALMTSMKTADYDKRHGRLTADSDSHQNTALVQPSLGAAGTTSIAEGGGYINPAGSVQKKREKVFDV